MERYPFYPPGFMRAEQTMNMNVAHHHDHHDHRDNCDLPLAMSYVPMQNWREIYECDKALLRGTVFCELDKPFRGSAR